MPETTIADQYRRLVNEVYNGDLAHLNVFVTEGFCLHVPGHPASALRGPEALRQLVTGARAPFSTLRFSVALGPVVSDGLVAARWSADGVYRGGIPGATAPSGTRVAFGGHDFLCITANRLSEYWGGADDGSLMAQLGFFDAQADTKPGGPSP